MIRFAFAILLSFACVVSAQEDAKAQVDVATKDDSWTIPADFTVRARVKSITPSAPTALNWRWGGEGLGGTPATGKFAEKLDVGEWSEPLAVSSFVKGKFPSKLFVTVTCGESGKRKAGGPPEGQSRNVEVEFEFSWQNKIVKTFVEKGPDGGTVGILIPAERLSGGRNPASTDFLELLCGISDYAEYRLKEVSKAATSAQAARFTVITDLGGYGEGHYYGVRHCNKAMVETECKTLRHLGVNSFAGAPPFLRAAVTAHEGFAKDFAHAAYLQLGGYPVPASRKGQQVADAGCPYGPNVAVRQAEMIESGVATALKAGVKEVWWRTEDEIGAVFDHAPEGKAHLAICPRCAEAFRTYLKEKGLKPADFGAEDWSAVKPANIFAKDAPAPKDRAESLAAYHTSIFLNVASAKLFTPLRDKLAQLNEDKIKNNKTEQPFVYSFALRGNTFLMGGHSLDFFDFYRHADNAFVYETSNRDIRITGWDSYLCDVGRVVSAQQKMKFGIYIKPHRGAPIQRMLAAVSRNAQMLYWYTYGPDYVKGDSFAESLSAVQDTARAASLLARAEGAVYGSAWMQPAEVAVVNPRSSEFWSKLSKATPAAYENAKWTYSALQHAHISVDAIDEGMLETNDLARFKIIYISGPNLTRVAAEKIAAWVRAGGTLYTSGGGLMRDEANQPLEVLQPLLGLQARKDPEMWYRVASYGATKLDIWDDPKNAIAPVPAGAEITAQPPFASFKPVVGREALQPLPETKVLAKFADGAAALTCAEAGKGKVYVAGFYPGLEYSAKVRREDFDMPADFDPARRAYIAAAALERVKPIVDATEPLVEGILLKNEAGQRAVTLANWAYRVSGKKSANGKTSMTKALVVLKDLKVTLRGAGAIQSVKSATLNKPLPFSVNGDVTTITVPELNEGDVLILE